MAGSSERERKRRGEEGKRPEKDTSPAAEARRQEYLKDFKKFYIEIVDPIRGHNLGKIHDLLIDFLNQHLTDVKTYTELPAYFRRSEDEPETWLYWRTLDQPPEVQSGPEGPITEMFRGRLWQGVVIRLSGDGRIRMALLPRGHLKSSVNTGRALWTVVREPESRSLIRCLDDDLAGSLLTSMQAPFTGSETFRELFGYMGPPDKKQGTWTNNAFQVFNEKYCDPRRWRSNGKEPTVSSYGVGSDATGGHYGNIDADDLVGEKNCFGKDKEKVWQRLCAMLPVMDPDGTFTVIGTTWAEDCANSRLLDPKQSELYEHTSFMVATCLDADESAETDRKLSPLGYGKSIWPFITPKRLKLLRAGMQDDFLWFGQMFNQFRGTSLRLFNKGWLTRYEGVPEEVARELKLDVFLAMDQATGKSLQHGKLDCTAMAVLGQTLDRERLYVLDLVDERIPAQLIAKTFARKAVHWRNVVAKYGGLFLSGLEEVQIMGSGYLKELALTHMRVMGIAAPSIVDLEHKRSPKEDRIRILTTPFSERRILIPNAMVVPSVLEEDEHGNPCGPPYDVLERFLNEYEKYPGINKDDILDGLSYAERMTLPRFGQEEAKQQEDVKRRGLDKRPERNEEQRGFDYEEPGKWQIAGF